MIEKTLRRFRRLGRPSADHQGDPVPDIAITTSLSAVQPLVVTPVDPLDMPIWNATMATFHPLGYQQAFGARCRARIVNNSRFLILPRMHIPHLASHVLGLGLSQKALVLKFSPT